MSLEGCGYAHISEAAVLVARGGINTLLDPQAYVAIVAELRKMPVVTADAAPSGQWARISLSAQPWVPDRQSEPPPSV